MPFIQIVKSVNRAIERSGQLSELITTLLTGEAKRKDKQNIVSNCPGFFSSEIVRFEFESL